jgi:L-ascorbate metabolism protein UlaG (beta-lactamase superfamily)
MIVKAVNHASVLIQEDDNFILTDPWYEQPAFGSWLPVPPTSIHPVYLLALAKDNPKFKILISHGHDDHLDDEWLSLFPKDVTIIIPEYKSKGFLSRLKKLGLTNINEASNDGLQSDIFKIKSYVNSDISMDDAILTIETPNNFVVHANDNWQEIEGDSLKTLQTDANKFKSENIL